MRQDQPRSKTAPDEGNCPVLVLGTAAFGQPYGLGQAGQAGGLSPEALDRLLDHAHARGVAALDTARSYGASERIIGAWMAKNSKYFNIFSKCTKLGSLSDAEAGRQVAEDVSQSLALLETEQLGMFLTHHPADILRPAIADALREQQRTGRIAGFGVSLYSPAEAEQALAVEGISAIQAPVSILNQSFLTSPVLARARQAGIRVFVRNVYAQGLLFLDPDRLPLEVPATAQRLRDLRRMAAETGHDLSVLALTPLAVRTDIAGVVVGCDTPEQLDHMVDAITTQRPAPEILQRVLDICAGIPAHEIDPRQWRRKA